MVLRRIEGVEDADVSYEAGKAVVTYDPTVTSPDEFIPTLEEMTGYQAEIADGDAGALPSDVGVVHDEDDGHEHDSAGHQAKGGSSR